LLLLLVLLLLLLLLLVLLVLLVLVLLLVLLLLLPCGRETSSWVKRAGVVAECVLDSITCVVNPAMAKYQYRTMFRTKSMESNAVLVMRAARRDDATHKKSNRQSS